MEPDRAASVGADGRLDADLECRGCRYALRGSDPAGSCPECGLPVADTLEDHPVFAPAHWLDGLRQALTRGVIGAALLIGVGVIQWGGSLLLSGPAWRGLDAILENVVIIPEIGGFLLLLLGFHGLFRTEAPHIEVEARRARWGRAAVTTVIALYLAGLLVRLVTGGDAGALIRWIHIVLAVGMGVVAVFVMLRARGLAARFRRPRLRHWMPAATVVYILSMGLSWIPVFAGGGVPVYWIAIAGGVLWLTAVATAAILGWRLRAETIRVRVMQASLRGAAR